MNDQGEPALQTLKILLYLYRDYLQTWPPGHGGCYGRQIGLDMNVPNSTLYTMLADLSHKGLIENAPHRRHYRRYYYRLTASGLGVCRRYLHAPASRALRTLLNDIHDLVHAERARAS